MTSVVKAAEYDPLLSSNHLCDRRRSRAARELLRRHLIRTWQETNRLSTASSLSSSPIASSENHNYNKYNEDVNEWNVWQLLDATLIRNNDHDIRNEPSCPLLPQYDVYKEHEESYSVLDMSSAVVPNRYRNTAIPGMLHHSRVQRKISGKSTSPQQLQELYPLIYHCDLCQKSFTSQYYLDYHLTSKHSLTQTNMNTPKLSDRICPADIYCSFLSPIVCDDFMMQLEPYYGPGHANTQPTATTKFTCGEQKQQRAVQTCHEIVTLCFDESMLQGKDNNAFGEIFSTNVCSTIPTCQTRLVHNVMNTITTSTNNLFHPRFSHEYWSVTMYDHHTTTTWIALFIVTFIFILIFGHYVYQLFLAILQRQGQQERRSTEKVNKDPSPDNISRSHRTLERIVSQPPTTYIVPTKVKRT